MASRLADILQQEYKTKGLIEGTASALSKSSREKMDIRNRLFGGSNLGSIVGRKIFGKGYSATSRTNKTSDIASASIESQSLNTPLLEHINQNLSYLPAMARDMNVLRQNFSKFLILQKVSPANAPDKYFEKAKQRENLYEAGFNKGSKGTTPTKLEEKKENKGILGGLLSGLGGLLGGTFSAIGSVAGGLVLGLAKLGSSLALALIGGFTGTLRAIFGKSRVGKIILGLLGIGVVGAGAEALAGTNITGSIDDALAGLINPETVPGVSPETNISSNQGSVLSAAGYGLGAYTAYQGTKFTGQKLGTSINRPEAKTKFGELYEKKTTTSMILDKEGKPITTTEAAKKLPLTEVQEKMGKRVVEMQKKGWFSRLMAAVLKRFGIGLVARIGVLLGSISASVATGGVLAPALAIANAALWGVFLYELYQFIEECWAIWSKDEGAKEKNTSPTLENPEENNPMGTGAEAIVASGNKPTQTGINVPRVTSPFGENRGDHQHGGVDLGAKTPGVPGDPIYSTGDGEVSVASFDNRSGNYIKIKHSDGTESLYAHLQSFSVKPGQKVKKGEQIGEMGSTGNSTNPHLHYEKRNKDGKKITPTQEELYAAINSSTQMAALQQQNPRGAGFSNKLNSYATAKAAASQSAPQVVNNTVNNNQASQKPQQETFAALPTVYDQYFSNKLVSRTTL